MIKDPYIGMPIIIDTSPDIPGGCGCFEDNGNNNSGENTGDTDNTMPGKDFDNMYLGGLPLAMCYVPMQRWNTTYSLQKGLERGTIFPELDLPFLGGRER